MTILVIYRKTVRETFFHLFASVEQLATMLKAKSETEHKTKEFLKSTISDISHQLKNSISSFDDVSRNYRSGTG